jgi:hypothetical protein
MLVANIIWASVFILILKCKNPPIASNVEYKIQRMQPTKFIENLLDGFLPKMSL